MAGNKLRNRFKIWSSRRRTDKIIKKAFKDKKEENKKEKPKRVIIFKYKLVFNTFKGKIVAGLRSQKATEIKEICAFVLGYGVLAYLAYYAVFIRERWYVMLLGLGAIVYLFHDTFEFIWDKVKIIWLWNRAKK